MRSSWRPLSTTLPLVHDNDFIGIHDGGESVGDDDGRSFPHDPCERLLHVPLALRIECTGGFVEQQQLGIDQNSPCQRQPLALAA